MARWRIRELERCNREAIEYVSADKEKDSMDSKLLHNQSDLAYAALNRADRVQESNSPEIQRNNKADFETNL